MSTHYRIVTGVFVADNISPESRHLFIAEVESDKVLRHQATEGRKSGTPEQVIKTALEDITCDLLDKKEGKILRLPFVTVQPDTQRVRLIGKSVTNKSPDLARDGVKVWYCGNFKAAA